MKTFALATLLILAAGGPSWAQGGPSRDSVMHFTSGPLTLEATLTLPGVTGPRPDAVIIAGSGPTDRNGNKPGAVTAETYAKLARVLAERGNATHRYDKRS
jgi:hypothetical protein